MKAAVIQIEDALVTLIRHTTNSLGPQLGPLSLAKALAQPYVQQIIVRTAIDDPYTWPEIPDGQDPSTP